MIHWPVSGIGCPGDRFSSLLPGRVPLGLGRPQWLEGLVGVAAAQFGVCGDGVVPLMLGCALPVDPVVHHAGEHVLAVAVGAFRGPAADGQRLVPRRRAGLAVFQGCLGFGVGADRGEPGVVGHHGGPGGVGPRPTAVSAG